jgi:transcriptional regulator with XRE-family HTH domain
MSGKKTEWNDAIKAQLKAIGVKVKDHRTTLCHMSQQEVSRHAGISIPTLRKIERGEADVTYRQLALLSEVFNNHSPYIVTLSHLLEPSQDQTASMLGKVKSMRSEAEAMPLDELEQSKETWRDNFGVDVEDIYQRRKLEGASDGNAPSHQPTSP